MTEFKKPYKTEAHELVDAIRKLANNEEALDNFENYLSYHFAAWMEKYAGYPEGLVSEMECFAKMFDYKEDN